MEPLPNPISNAGFVSQVESDGSTYTQSSRPSWLVPVTVIVTGTFWTGFALAEIPTDAAGRLVMNSPDEFAAGSSALESSTYAHSS